MLVAARLASKVLTSLFCLIQSCTWVSLAEMRRERRAHLRVFHSLVERAGEQWRQRWVHLAEEQTRLQPWLAVPR